MEVSDLKYSGTYFIKMWRLEPSSTSGLSSQAFRFDFIMEAAFENGRLYNQRTAISVHLITGRSREEIRVA